jgi:CubicO group peptidase (beta-lactamase class C family)
MKTEAICNKGEKSMIRFIIIFVLIAFFLIGCINNEISQQHDFNQLIDQLDQVIPRLLDKYKTTGAAIALIQNGEVVWMKGYGFADKEKGIKVTPNTVFQAASISKPVTAWAIMKLVEDGKLNLDAPVENYLTRWHLPSSEFDVNGVTIRRLLSHTAGLSLGGYPGYHPGDKIPTLEESLSGKNSSNVEVRIIKEPGYEFDYSGGGYTLLSLLIEEVTGVLFEDYMHREILQPLGMINSSYLWADPLKELTASGYNRKREPLPNYLFSGKGSASLFTTASDLANYVAAALPGPNGEAGRKILSPETVALMCTTVAQTVGDISLFFDGMGLGYFINTYKDGTKLVAHTGSNRGWRNILALSPKTGDGIVILTNSNNGRNAYVKILEQWSISITGKTPKMCVFFNTTFHISRAIVIILILVLILFIVWNIRNNSLTHRTLFWRIQHKPLWKKVLRIMFNIILPVMFTSFWYLFLHPLLLDISPLTSGWVTLGIFSWGIIAVATGIFPKPKS